MVGQMENQMISGRYGPELESNRTPWQPRDPPSTPPAESNRHDLEDIHNGQEFDEHEISDENAESLVGVSIGRVATHLMSPTTPAAEKAAAMDDIDGGGVLPSDEDITPPPEPINFHLPHSSRQEGRPGHLESAEEPVPFLDKLSSSDLQDYGLPSRWTAGPKISVIERPEETRSVLRDALSLTKRRSLSGGADALKKFLPSMPKAGAFIPNLASSSFFSSNSDQKSRSRAISLSRVADSKTDSSLSTSEMSSHTQQAMNEKHDDQEISTNSAAGTQFPPIRRIASDDSLLYNSLSRTSSLGDDTRFENNHEMVNSRFKAIRDSLQDRSSFRLPALPNMPRVPNFSFAMNFAFNTNPTPHPLSLDTGADSTGDPNDGRGLGAASNPVVAAGMVGAAISRPEAVVDPMRPAVEVPNDGTLERVMASLTGDIVIMGGYRGSVLRSAKPPHRQLWVPVKVGLNIRKVNLEVGLELEDEERMEESIYSSGMLQNIGPVDISKRLFKRLRECENAKNGKLRIWDYGYDWRLSPHLLSKKLIKFMESLPSNQQGVANKDRGALVVAHSLGGLITRHAVNQRPELFSGVIFAGVPQACVNILGPIRNGDAVLLSSRVLTAQVNFTFRTSFVLLPLDGYCFVDKNTGKKYPVDYFNVDDWIQYRWSPCTDPPLPPKSQPTGALANILKQGSLTSLQLPGRRVSNPPKQTTQAQTPPSPSPVHTTESQRLHSQSTTLENDLIPSAEGRDRTLAPQMGNQSNPVKHGHSTASSVSTAVTIPRPAAIAYLRRTLAATKQFKLELAHDGLHEAHDRYPPLAIIYGKSVPTVYAAKVDGRDGIACADSYDHLAFASGDGVCLSREAMLPQGYHLVRGGRISTDRGHVTLLGDLNAVGRAIQAVTRGRAKGIGLQRGRGRDE